MEPKPRLEWERQWEYRWQLRVPSPYADHDIVIYRPFALHTQPWVAVDGYWSDSAYKIIESEDFDVVKEAAERHWFSRTFG